MEMEKRTVPGDALDFFIIPVGDGMIPHAISIAQTLRQLNLKVDIELMRRGIGKSLKYASTKNAAQTIIIGEDEQKQDAVTLRDMKTGLQQLIPLKDLFKNYDQ
jgi:histidyl-tRNA synthetase